jgi:hypothetical protein
MAHNWLIATGSPTDPHTLWVCKHCGVQGPAWLLSQMPCMGGWGSHLDPCPYCGEYDQCALGCLGVDVAIKSPSAFTGSKVG